MISFNVLNPKLSKSEFYVAYADVGAAVSYLNVVLVNGLAI
jgi:hypothetical protein